MKLIKMQVPEEILIAIPKYAKLELELTNVEQHDLKLYVLKCK